MAIVTVDWRVLGMVEASWRQKSRKHLDGRDPQCIGATLDNMAISASPARLEKDGGKRLLRFPRYPILYPEALFFVRRERSAWHAAGRIRSLCFRDTALQRQGGIEALDIGLHPCVITVRHLWFRAQVARLCVVLEGVATLTLAFIGGRKKTLAAWLRQMTVAADHLLVAENGKPLGDKVGGMRENEIGVVGRFGIAVEIGLIKAPFHGITNKGHAELRVPI